MLNKIFIPLAVMFLVLISTSALYAQGPTPGSGSLGSFLDNEQASVTPTPASSNAVTRELAQDGYVAITSGPWYDEAGKALSNSVHVLMLGAAADPKSADGVKQIVSGFVALRSAYPNAANYHVLLLNGPNIYDASTTANALQLLSSQLITPDAFLKDVLNNIRTINLVRGSSSGSTSSAGATTTPVSAQSTATRVPTRVPTKATNACNAPADKARLWVKNGYSGTMRFTVGAPDVGFQKDFDIPADGQYHYIDLPPSAKYTYSASIPGVGKASERLPAYSAGQCYYLTFQP